jgi:putative FmdB family regulatory protein
MRGLSVQPVAKAYCHRIGSAAEPQGGYYHGCCIMRPSVLGDWIHDRAQHRRGILEMPIYEYKCYACGHTFEILQKISDAPYTECPDCGKPTLKKLISATAFRLKGGGWYETDFKTGGKKNVAQPDKKEKTGKKSAGKDKPGSTATPKSGGSGQA